MANDGGGTDNITVVAVRFDGRQLTRRRASDEVRYRAFPGTGFPDAGTTPPDATAITRPWPTPTAVPAGRRRRGTLYARVIAVLGLVLALYAAWRLLTG
jgi:hypothetical protein